jgi:hypothetical protein
MAEIEALVPALRGEIADMASLLSVPALRDRVRIVESARVMSIRSLVTPARIDGEPLTARDAGGGAAAIALRGGEVTVVAEDDAALDRLCAGSDSNGSECVFEVDRSAGYTVFELVGDIDAWLARLGDAAAIPRSTGHGARFRIADVAAAVVRRAPDRAWLVVDRSLDHYMARWLAFAIERAQPQA